MHHCKKLLLCCLLLTFELKGQIFEKSSLSFSSSPNPFHTLEWVDADGDNDLDLLSFFYDENNSSASAVKLFENANGTFNLIAGAFGNEPLQVQKYVFGDHDRDGDIDFLYIDANNTLLLASNDGDLSFSLSETGLSADWLPHNFYWQDLDGDGDYDVMWPSVDPYEHTAIYLNTNGSYNKSDRRLPISIGFVSFADVNNDGLTDMLVFESNPEYGGVLYINQGDAYFNMQRKLVTAGSYDNKKNRWADFDADGDLDLFIYESNIVPVVYRNLWMESGEVLFEKGKPLSNGMEKIVVAGDFDLDGLPDLVMHGNFSGYTETRLFKNKSSTDSLHFESVKLEIPPHFLYSMDMLDFDGDRDLDLFFHGTELVNNVPMLALFLAGHSEEAPAPALPSALSVTTEHHTILSWNPVESGKAVSYLVQMRRNNLPYLLDMASPEGRLLAPEYYQSRLSPQALVRNLPEGDYSWRVAAVNAAGISSGFTNFAEFSISPAPSGLTIEALGLSSARLSWQASTPAAEAYHIYRRLPAQELQLYSSVDGSITSWVAENAPINLRQEYVVRAELAGKYSAYSDPVVFAAEQYQEQPFPDGNNFIAAEAFAADTDGDGNGDVLLVGKLENDDGAFFAMRNDGTGAFTPVFHDQLADINGSYISYTADFDNDGDEDFCVAVNHYGENRVQVFQNNNGAFAKVYESNPHQYIITLVVGDFDHDGLTDIIYGHTSSLNSQVYEYTVLNQRSISEFSRTEFPAEPGMSEGGRMLPGDFNNDGFTDLLFANTNGGYPVRVFENLRGQTFLAHETAIFGNGYFYITDYNQDGGDDVVTVSDSRIIVFEGEANFLFRTPYVLNVPGIYGSTDPFFQSADLDMNGFPDLVITTGIHTTILQNYGDGRWWQGNHYKIEGDSRRILLSDWEGDGDLDLFSFGRNQHEAVNSVIENLVISETNTTANEPPLAPQNVKLKFGEDGSPILSWDPATDDLTPAQYLSYNLHLHNAEGKVILSGKTNEAGSYRRVVGDGNMSNRTLYVFKALPGGSYTARLQTLDASFQLSDVTEFEFQIEQGPSALTVERVLLNKIKLSWTDPVQDEIKVILQRRKADTVFETIAELPANTTTYTDEQLLYNQEYSYRLYAVVNETPTSFSNEVSWNTQLFKARVTALPGLSASLEVADFTADGKMDILMRGENFGDGQSLSMSLYEYSGDGLIKREVGTGELNHGATVFSVHDFDGDHLPDIYEDGYNANFQRSSMLWLNNGGETFTQSSNAFTENTYQLIGWRDFDGDNDLDPVVYGTNHQISQLINVGNNQYDFKETERVNCDYYCPATMPPVSGDFDNDGDEDHVRYKSNQYEVVIKGAVSPDISYIVTSGSGRSQVQAIDYDSDGWLDLFFTTADYNYGREKTLLYRNGGLGENDSLRFELVDYEFPVGISSAIWADFDYDGDLDLLTISGKATFFFNDGNASFVAFNIRGMRFYESAIELIDFDDDGDLDVYVSAGIAIQEGQEEEHGFVLYNQLIEEGKGLFNQSPAQPTNLSAMQDVNGMRLNWTPPVDDHTASAGLTYDVVITRNRKAVTKGPLHPETARRYQFAPGRNQAAALLRDIAEVGLYYWKVQAVDQSYAGSPFSEEGEFFFIPQPPLMKDTLIYRCGRTVVLAAEGQNIEWYADEALSSRLATGTYSPSTTQTVWVTQTIDGVRGVPRKVEIIIQDKPNKPEVFIPYPFLFCESQIGTDFYASAVGESIVWFDNEGLRQSGEYLFTTVPAVTKSFFVNQSIQNCQSDPAEVKVDVLVINAEIYLKAGTFYARNDTAQSYQWFFNDEPIEGATQYFLLPEEEGEYKLMIANEHCSQISEPLQYAIAGIDDRERTQLTIYPNPASGSFSISLPFFEKSSLLITDMTGAVVYDGGVVTSQEQEITVDVKDWRSGVYFVRIQSRDQMLMGKLVVE